MLYLGLDPEYVMDKMEFYEIGAIMKHSYKKHMADYECARLGAYVTAQVNSKKQLKPQSICKFEWEDEKKMQEMELGYHEKKKARQEVTKSDAKRIAEKAAEFAKNFKAPV